MYWHGVVMATSLLETSGLIIVHRAPMASVGLLLKSMRAIEAIAMAVPCDRQSSSICGAE
ncbi:hypothetical protein EAG14_21355 [Acidovorax sp. 1608163]|nr:hypothetical protein EAG14_21355 [Acidovorax sp. 1608163]